MSKTACKKKEFSDKKDARFGCRRCGARVRKEDKVCKPRRLE